MTEQQRAPDGVEVSQTLTLTLPRRLVLSANGREHWRTRAAITADLRALARLACVTEGLRPMPGPVDAIVTIHWPDRRRHDAPNLSPTSKALIDGIVDAGVLPDDNDRVIASVLFRSAEPLCTRGHVRIAIELVEQP